MSEPQLTEAQHETLACVDTGHHPDVCDCSDEYVEPDRYCEHAHETFARVEQILAEHTQALEAEVERLKRGGKTLGKSLDYWMRLAQQVTGSDDVIQDDGDGDWGVVAERLAALGAQAEAAEAEVERLREGLTELARAGERDGRGNALVLATDLRALLDGGDH